MKDIQPDVNVIWSNGRGKYGVVYVYIRPVAECINRSRRVGAHDPNELYEKVKKAIEKWYGPKVVLYTIDGYIIGSNSPGNALKEYWRRCDVESIGKQFEVKEIERNDTK